MGQKFFISFNSADRTKAHWIAWTLKEAGHEVAVHDWEIPAGGNAPLWMNTKLAWAANLQRGRHHDWEAATEPFRSAQARWPRKKVGPLGTGSKLRSYARTMVRLVYTCPETGVVSLVAISRKDFVDVHHLPQL